MSYKLDEHGMIVRKTLPDGKILAVLPLTFDRARLTLGPNLDYWDEGW